MIKDYKDLEVWKLSRVLVKSVYQLTEPFPKREWFGLAAQMRRASISIPLNIAEGFARHGTKDYINFVSVAIGSATELEASLLLACDLEYTTQKEIEPLLENTYSILRMLHKLRQSLKAKL